MSTLPTAPEDPREWKIFPRNLTARAAYIVPGNPIPTRPEDGVDNCYPGLEMDAKNIQKNFFPGFYFEVYRTAGAKLVELKPPSTAQQWIDMGLKPEDLQDNFYLWALHGKNNDLSGHVQLSTINFTGKGGLYAWRQINSLLPGDVSVAFGPNPAVAGASLNAALAQMEQGDNKIERGASGKLTWAVFTAPRLDYLTEEGVLDPEVYDPGDLTRTLCTPWTYDFRDCQCFYWASNKPDVISSEDGQYEYLNFQRKNRHVEPQTQDIAYGYEARRQREIDYAEMMDDWGQLRPVLNGREFGETYVPPDGPSGPLLTLEQIKEEVSYLATVEHALAVQYLYAFYSVDVPWDEPVAEDLKTFRLWHSARTVFDIAIDEMRHFRWANEILQILGAETTAKRASTLGRIFKVPFFLQSLSSPQLQWFIDVERPSRSTVAGLDGMYVGILHSLQQLDDNELAAEKQRKAVEIVKLIVDEGEGHYVRFSTAQQNFAFYDDVGREDLPSYVLGGEWSKATNNADPDVPYTTLYGVPAKAASGSTGEELQDESDRYYQTLLMLLKIVFAIPEAELSGGALRRAIAVMFAMNRVNLELAQSKHTPLFTLPEGWEQDPPVRSKADALELLAKAQNLMAQPKSAIVKTAAAPKIEPKIGLTEDPAHQATMPEVFSVFKKAIEESQLSQ